MMTTDNALDPPRWERRKARAPYGRIAAIVTAVVVAVAVIFAIGQIVLKHPAAQPTADAGATRGRAAASVVQPPPAVAPKLAAETSANLRAMQRAANAPGLAARPVQVASVSPPAGPPPSGVGVTPSKSGIGRSAG